MDVHVPKTWENCHAFSGNDFGTGGNGQFANTSDRFDPLALDENDAITNRLAAESIDKRSANKRLHVGGLSLARGTKNQKGRKEAQKAKKKGSEESHSDLLRLLSIVR